jgi:hypothetical protein
LSPTRDEKALESSRRQKRKYDLLLKKFTDLQKDYNVLKSNKENRNIISTQPYHHVNPTGTSIKHHTSQYLNP